MRNNKFYVAVVVGAVMYFILGWLFYGMAMMNFMHSNAGSATGVEREVPIFWVLFLGNLAWSYLICTILSRWSDVTTTSAGAIRAATVAFLVSVSIDFVQFATSHVWGRWAVAADIITWTIINAIAGAVITLMLGMGKKSTVAS